MERETWMSDRLADLLRSRSVGEDLIRDVLDSGFVLKDWLNPVTTETYITVSDLMYGSKQFSSSFEINEFVRYISGSNVFSPLPPFREFTVRNREELRAILEDPIRQRYIAEGSLTFRGQHREHHFRRRIPNPRRADPQGRELSILPGAYRQDGPEYSFSAPVDSQHSIRWFLHELEPNGDPADSQFAYDISRVEQHYATPTGGLDLSFNIETALFFATHWFTPWPSKKATYEPVASGVHAGVIYCFRFNMPTVRRTEYEITSFDFFKTYRPERILRQTCGLPMIGDFERNIAITDIDCVIRLHRDFECADTLAREYLFPGVREDAFYRKLLELKDRHPGTLENLVEYTWARA
jgi:hypothetical protein